MKTSKFYFLLIAAFIGVYIVSCTKDSNVTSSAAVLAATAQDDESADAVASKIDQDADVQLDALESSSFNTTNIKNVQANGVTVTVDHPGETIFPKNITLTYNFKDTVNGEYMTQTGTIAIKVDTLSGAKRDGWRKHLKRTFTFTDFSVATDSSSFTINGTRSLNRLDFKQSINADKTKLRVVLLDTIIADFTIGVTSGKFSGSFTRKLNKSRNAIVHFSKPLAANKLWIPLLNDTTTFKGKITGMNLKHDEYSREITTPLIITMCPIWPHNPIMTGVIKDMIGTNQVIITYLADGCRTKITAVNGEGKEIKIDRKTNRQF